jgi:hypothetical protein
MKMICRKCKRIVTLNELAGYACGHFATFMVSSGLAVCLATALKDYFLNAKRGFIDETMAGACNGLKMACPKCKKTSCWDPLPEIELQKKEKERQVTTK